MKVDPHLLEACRFAALGDPTRLRVFRLIAQRPLSVVEVAARRRDGGA